MVPPLPAVSRPSKIERDARSGVARPSLHAHELDLQREELALVGLAPEVRRHRQLECTLLVEGSITHRRAS